MAKTATVSAGSGRNAIPGGGRTLAANRHATDHHLRRNEIRGHTADAARGIYRASRTSATPQDRGEGRLQALTPDDEPANTSATPGRPSASRTAVWPGSLTTGLASPHHQYEQVMHRRTGRFFYRTVLPSGINTDKAEARMKDGVLTIRRPKAEQAAKRVQIRG